jgi:phosphoribosylformylglycinamidine synthase
MGHSERGVGMGPNGVSFDLFKNVGGNPLTNPVETTCQNIFAAGVSYFK